jgi:SAM-dependent methyltransferase
MATFDPIRHKEIEREVYSRTAENYARFGGPIFESMASPLLKGANLNPGQNILDVACGIGIPSLSAAQMVIPDGSVIGIDLAPGMIEIARSRAAEKGLKNIEFREADAAKPSLRKSILRYCSLPLGFDPFHRPSKGFGRDGASSKTRRRYSRLCVEYPGPDKSHRNCLKMRCYVMASGCDSRCSYMVRFWSGRNP